MQFLRVLLSTLLVTFYSSVLWARADSPTFLEQGWDESQREWYYHASQGSQLIPYQWIQALEAPNNKGRFLEEVVKHYGYIKSPYKSDLPLGFTRDDKHSDQEWLGLTCAACHTQQIKFAGKTYIIDGGPASADLMGFLAFMYDALHETLKDEKKFKRFAEGVLGKTTSVSSEGLKELRQKVTKRTVELHGQAGLEKSYWNHTEVKYGPGRVDAIGLLTNEILGVRIDRPENYRSPNAPTNYPSIWYAPRFTQLQWNGALAQSETRNVGEALGVFVSFTFPKGCLEDCINPTKLFQSTLHTQNLGQMWTQIKELRPPKWPGTGALVINTQLASTGRAIYEDKNRGDCIGCHPVIDENSTGDINTQPMQSDTDPLMAKNFLERKAHFPVAEVVEKICKKVGGSDHPGKRRSLLQKGKELVRAVKDLLQGEDLLLHMLQLVGGSHINCQSATQSVTEKTPQSARDLVQIVGAGIILQAANDDSGFRNRIRKELAKRIKDNVLHPGEKSENSAGTEPAYKTGPLAGIWATAPYLHNGSVPNLEELLKPGDRIPTFCVGSREFDPDNVGFTYQTAAGKSCESQGWVTFETTLPGNSNKGHVYGTQLSPDERKALIEYLKTL